MDFSPHHKVTQNTCTEQEIKPSAPTEWAICDDDKGELFPCLLSHEENIVCWPIAHASLRFATAVNILLRNSKL